MAILADGRIEQSGKPEEVYHAPKNRRVAEFLGMTNFVDGQVLSTQPLTVKTALGTFGDIQCGEGSTRMGESVTLLIPSVGAKLDRDEKSPDRIAGIVTECVFRGNDYRICLKIDHSISMTFILAEACTVNRETTLYFSEKSILCLEK